MTRIEYELLASERPDLKLPTWTLMWEESQLFVEEHTRDEIISRRVANQLRGDDCGSRVINLYRATHFD